PPPPAPHHLPHHAALPISFPPDELGVAELSALGSGPTVVRPGPASGRHGGAVRVRAIGARTRHADARARSIELRTGEPQHMSQPDRKSTRLNSSHVSSSYA